MMYDTDLNLIVNQIVAHYEDALEDLCCERGEH